MGLHGEDVNVIVDAEITKSKWTSKNMKIKEDVMVSISDRQTGSGLADPVAQLFGWNP